MICPKCRADIDDDSFFCDQCGNEINVCPQCGRAGRGKVCTEDGSRLVAAKSRRSRDSARPAQREEVNATDGAPKESPASTLVLLNKSLGLEIKPKSGDILGRKIGPYAGLLASSRQISGEHLRFTFDNSVGWCVEDLGSTNGTNYNGLRLQPKIRQALKDKSFLMVANIEFFVRIEPQADIARTTRA